MVPSSRFVKHFCRNLKTKKGEVYKSTHFFVNPRFGPSSITPGALATQHMQTSRGSKFLSLLTEISPHISLGFTQVGLGSGGTQYSVNPRVGPHEIPAIAPVVGAGDTIDNRIN